MQRENRRVRERASAGYAIGRAHPQMRRSYFGNTRSAHEKHRAVNTRVLVNLVSAAVPNRVAGNADGAHPVTGP